MCFHEFIAYQCGHRSIPVARPCPLTTSATNLKVCAMRPVKQFNVTTMCVACERILHFRWILVREWEHRWMHERGVCGCAVKFPGLLFQPRMSGDTSSFSFPAQSENNTIPAPYAESILHGHRRVAVRLPGLYAAEWTADHARLHQTGTCDCGVNFQPYTPEVDDEHALTHAERAVLDRYRELESHPASLTADEVTARVQEIVRLFGPFMPYPLPPAPIPPSAPVMARNAAERSRRRRRQTQAAAAAQGTQTALHPQAAPFYPLTVGLARQETPFTERKNQGMGYDMGINPLYSNQNPPLPTVQPISQDNLPMAVSTPMPATEPSTPPAPPTPTPTPTAPLHQTQTPADYPTFWPKHATLVPESHPPVLLGPGPFTTTGLDYTNIHTHAHTQTATTTASVAVPVPGGEGVASPPDHPGATESAPLALCGLPVGAGPEGDAHVPRWEACRLGQANRRYTFTPPPPTPASHYSF